MTLIEQLLDKAAYSIEPDDRNDARQKIIQRFNDLEKVVELALEYVPERHRAHIRAAKEKAVNG